MKKVSFIFLLLSMGIIIYFFIKEQFRGIALSQKENIFLAVTYLIVGIALLILFRLKNLENKKEKHTDK